MKNIVLKLSRNHKKKCGALLVIRGLFFLSSAVVSSYSLSQTIITVPTEVLLNRDERDLHACKKELKAYTQDFKCKQDGFFRALAYETCYKNLTGLNRDQFMSLLFQLDFILKNVKYDHYKDINYSCLYHNSNEQKETIIKIREEYGLIDNKSLY